MLTIPRPPQDIIDAHEAMIARAARAGIVLTRAPAPHGGWDWKVAEGRAWPRHHIRSGWVSTGDALKVIAKAEGIGA